MAELAASIEFVSVAAGGPLKYTGRDMKTIHAGMKITAEEFETAANTLASVLRSNRVPQKESDELMKLDKP